MKLCIRLIFVLILLCSAEGLSQTCCSGGVPVSNTLGLISNSGKGFTIGVSYDHHNLNSLYNSSERVSGNSRRRITDSYLLQTGVAFEKLTFEALVPYIIQKRLISGQNADAESSQGIGDLALLTGWRFGPSQNWHLAAGIKLPTGKITSRSNLGIILNADMQSGTGTYDAIISGRYSKAIKNKTVYALFFNSLRGTKLNFQPGLDYRFGNEAQLTFGGSIQEVLLKQLVDFGLAARFRVLGENFANGQSVPGTGGQWILLNGSARLYFNEGLFSIWLNGDIPVFHRVNGLQNVPTYRTTLGLITTIKSSKE